MTVRAGSVVDIPVPTSVDLNSVNEVLHRVGERAMQDPELKKNFEAGGFETLDTINSAAAAAYVAQEVKRWTPILAHFKPQ